MLIDKKRIPGLLLIMALILILSLWSVFYINSAARKYRVIGVSYMTMNNQFYEVLNNEVKKVVDSHGDRLIVYDPQMNLEKQIQQIQSFIEQKVDGIIVNPIDSTALAPYLTQARQSGIPVVIADVPVFHEKAAVTTIASDNYATGVLCARDLMENWDEAEILLLEHSQVVSAKDRIQGFVDTLNPYPQYKIVDRAECEGQLELAMPAVSKMLQEHPNADVIMALNDPSAMGALAALEAAGNSGVKIYGVDGSPDVKKQILSNNQMYATAAQSPVTMGTKAAESLYEFLNNGHTEELIIVPVRLLKREDVTFQNAAGWQ